MLGGTIVAERLNEMTVVMEHVKARDQRSGGEKLRTGQ